MLQLLLLVASVIRSQGAWNWVGNGHFSGARGADAQWGSYGAHKIVAIEQRALPRPPSGADHVLWFPPRWSGGGEYEIHARGSMGAAKKAIYSISAWVYIDGAFNGNPEVLHSRWWTTHWSVIGTTWAGGAVNLNMRNKWQYVEVSFDSRRKKPVAFSLYVGYPMTNRRGNMYVTDIVITERVKCGKGYKRQYNKCIDINECAIFNGNCYKGTTCTNLDGEFKCSRCPDGYHRPVNSITDCRDIDECSMNNGGCDHKAKCTNTPGSFRCESCPKGYKGNPKTTGCMDVDECASEEPICGKRECINTPGGMSCGKCPLGFELIGGGCTDVDECKTNNGGCDELTTCTNHKGSFGCGPCPNGYEGTGLGGCEDVDECLTDNGGCDPKATCVNTPGSRECGPCPAGYNGDGYLGCKLKAEMKKETKKDIARMVAVKSEKSIQRMYDTTQADWKQQEKYRKEDKVDGEEITLLGARIQNLKWMQKMAKEKSLKLSAKNNLVAAKVILQDSKEKVDKLYRDHFADPHGPMPTVEDDLPTMLDDETVKQLKK